MRSIGLNSVSMGRAYGAMLRERYLEIRYEDLCGSSGTSRSSSQRSHCRNRGCAQPRPSFVHRQAPEISEAVSRSGASHRKTLLLSLGYLEKDSEPATDSSGAREPRSHSSIVGTKVAKQA